MNVFDTLNSRGYIKRVSDDEAVRELLDRPPVTIYQGFDPTASSLHVGHFMSLMVFHYLQQAGHRMIFLVGGGTGIVGDPSGRSDARRKLTREEIQRNADAIKRQVQGIGLVDFEAGNPPALMLNNADWLDMPLFDFLEQVAPHFSVNVLIKQDTFARRLADRQNLSLFEFMYPTLQGFDFLYQFDHYDCRMQVGGDDQWGNLVAGLDLIQNVRHKPAHVMTFPLLLDSSRQKMGKTSGGKALWLDPAQVSPFDFFQYWINAPDDDQPRNFRLFTFLPLGEIDQIVAGDRRAAARRLAFEITRIVHGEAAAQQAEADSLKAFGGAGLPQDVPTITLTGDEAAAGVLLTELLVRAGIKSKGEAKRLIEGGGVQVNDTRVSTVQQKIGRADLRDLDGGRAAVVRYGKGKILRVLLKA
ncbi:MAG: tyrosine--tRNA ligase [Chloroflexi bacterium]|nr:tyrosine--tRNA ligase [Chloroflexota bacterium]